MLSRRQPMSRGTRQLASRGFSAAQCRTSARGGAVPPADAEAAREQRLRDRAARALASACPRPASMVACTSTQTAACEKDNALRSEPYRRLVASMRCAWCGVSGFSQYAHENMGKGLGLKVDDRRGFPLCGTRPGVEGCHVAFDQYRLLPGGRDAHRAAGARWAAQAREQVRTQGLWPPRLPLWAEGDHEDGC